MAASSEQKSKRPRKEPGWYELLVKGWIESSSDSETDDPQQVALY